MSRDRPVNGTSATIARRMSGSRAGFLRLPRLPRPESGSLDGPPRPPEVAFFLCRRGVSPSPAASRLFRDPASGSTQRLWMSIVGARQATIGRRRDRHEAARVRPSRWAARERARSAAGRDRRAGRGTQTA